MEKAWFKNYPQGCSPSIKTDGYSSMLDIFDQAVKTYSDKTAYVSFGQSISYSQIEQHSKNFAAYLQNSLGVKKGERVALMCPNTFSFAIAMWGIFRVGGVQVSINPLYTPIELEHQLNDAQVETIIIFSASTKTLAEVIDNTQIKKVILVHLDDLVNKGLPSEAADSRLKDTVSFIQSLDEGKALSLESPELSQDDLLLLQYTGGTTGLSKGAMLTHGNVIANILQYEEFVRQLIDKGKETIITAIPMYHIFALAVNTLSYFKFGSKNVLIANPRDMQGFIKTWQQTKATFFTGVNTLFNGLVHTPGFSDIDFSSLKLTVGGGAPVQEAVSQKWKEITGRGIKEGYGLSETSPVLTLNLGGNEDYISGIGIPLPS
ncbi:MAG: AMP-binding protein, partial [Nitrospinaceae bacterium]|nr:AMP-binding protein [Nitrospinaceae bacterium]